MTSKSRHFQEKYPTFDMLEQGEYPTFAEIGVLLAKGIDFEARQDENILPDIDEEYSIEEFTKELTAFNISRVVEQGEDDNLDFDSIVLEESIKSNESETERALKSPSDENLGSNPFVQKESTNPFLTEDSCQNSVISSGHNSLEETIVSKKDESAQCNFLEKQTEISQEYPISIPQFGLYMSNNSVPYISSSHYYNSMNSPSINYSTGWQYMCNSGQPYMANSTVRPFNPPPGFEHVIPRGGVVYYQ